MVRLGLIIIFVFLSELSYATTYTVTSNADAGAGTLRQSILDANANPGKDTVIFAPGGFSTITLTGGTLAITDSIVIDGRTNTGYAPNQPTVEINGNGNNIFELNGIANTPHTSEIYGLYLYNSNNAILLVGVNGITIKGCIIGLDATNTLRSNSFAGIFSQQNCSNITIGGDQPGERNVISGNLNAGIRLETTDSVNIVGNYIGTDTSGTLDRGNASHGIFINNSEEYTIGNGTVEGRNIIGFNGSPTTPASGIQINSINNLNIIGNYIGTDSSGLLNAGNEIHGLEIINSDNVVIGGSEDSLNIFASSVGQHGLAIINVNNILVKNNYAGIGSDGSTPLGNAVHGFLLSNCNNATIYDNVIGNNTFQGINVDLSPGIIIQSNKIGTTADGNTDAGNSIHGIQIFDSPNALIGGDSLSEGNLISGNAIHGINMERCDSVNIFGNKIGTNITGLTAIPNEVIGVVIKFTHHALIGDTANNYTNIISGNGSSGLLLPNSDSNTVRGNLLGVASDTSDLGNGASGIEIKFENTGFTAIDNVVEYNIIAFNAEDGINIGQNAAPDFGQDADNIAGNEKGNTLRFNSIYCNGDKGIDLYLNASLPNDPGNNGKVTPSIDISSSILTIDNLSIGDSVDIYIAGPCNDCESNPAGQAQGFQRVTSLEANASSITYVIDDSLKGSYLTVIATDVDGNTSEFSNCDAPCNLPEPVFNTPQCLLPPFDLTVGPVSYPSGTYLWTLNGSPITPNTDSLLVVNNGEEGEYIVQVADPACGLDDTITIAFDTEPDVNLQNVTPEGCNSGSYFLEASGGPMNGSLFWSSSNNSFSATNEKSVTVKPSEGPVTYTVTFTDISTSCFDEASITLSPEISTVYPYEAISPNGDSFNETWTVECLDAFVNNNVKILNRWGNIVFEADGYDNDTIVWEGNNDNGKSLESGTYFYIIDLGDGSEPLSGYVLINRE